MKSLFIICMLLVILAMFASPSLAAPPQLKTMVLPGGTEIGYLFGDLKPQAPTVFILCGSIRDILATQHNYRFGKILWEKAGYNVYTVNMIDFRPNETAGELNASIDRINKGEKIADEFSKKMSIVLDDLTAAKYRDPDGMVVVMGISRGGWLAGQWAAQEPRIKKIVEMAPLVDYTLLREAGGKVTDALRAASQMEIVKKLTKTDIWMSIGCYDKRVGTEAVINFERALVAAAVADGGDPKVELTIFSTQGHYVPLYATDLAAAWVIGERGPLDE